MWDLKDFLRFHLMGVQTAIRLEILRNAEMLGTLRSRAKLLLRTTALFHSKNTVNRVTAKIQKLPMTAPWIPARLLHSPLTQVSLKLIRFFIMAAVKGQPWESTEKINLEMSLGSFEKILTPSQPQIPLLKIWTGFMSFNIPQVGFKKLKFPVIFITNSSE